MLLCGACAWTPPVEQTASPLVAATESCQMLGQLTARADCACYDKMSYDRVRGRAAQMLREEARIQFPDSDTVEVSGVDMYLNNAVAHGVAYKCFAKSAGNI